MFNSRAHEYSRIEPQWNAQRPSLMGLAQMKQPFDQKTCAFLHEFQGSKPKRFNGPSSHISGFHPDEIGLAFHGASAVNMEQGKNGRETA